jgi:hypothetical protein
MALPIITDPNVPTNLGTSGTEDCILVARTSDLILWESVGSKHPHRLRKFSTSY